MFLWAELLFAPNTQLAGAGSEHSTACPPNWVQADLVDMGCILFNSSMAVTWLDANIYCQTEENAISVEIKTADAANCSGRP